MENIKKFFKKVTSGIKDVFIRFPGVIVFLVIYYIFNPVREGFFLNTSVTEDIFCLGMYGMWMSFILEIVLENLRQKGARLRLICYGIVAVLLSIMLVTGFFSLGFNFSTKIRLNYSLGMFALETLLLVSFAHRDRGSFEKNCAVLFVNAVKVGFFSVLLISGVEVLLLGIDFLLEIGMKNVYREVFLLGSIFLYNFMFLVRIPRVGDDVECPEFLKDLLKYVLVPVTLGGVVILGLYLLKCKFILKEVLKLNMLFYIVPIMVYAAIVSVFGSLVENKSTETTRKILAVLLIPFVLLLLYLIGRFYVENGIMFIVYTSVVACIVVCVFVAGVLLKNSRYQYMGFLTLGILLVIASVGPFTPIKLVERSQQKRITAIFEKYNMIKDNKIVDSDKISNADVKKIRKIEEYLGWWGLNKPDYYGGSEWIHNLDRDTKNDSDEAVEKSEDLGVEQDNVFEDAKNDSGTTNELV